MDFVLNLIDNLKIIFYITLLASVFISRRHIEARAIITKRYRKLQWIMLSIIFVFALIWGLAASYATDTLNFRSIFNATTDLSLVASTPVLLWDIWLVLRLNRQLKYQG